MTQVEECKQLMTQLIAKVKSQDEALTAEKAKYDELAEKHASLEDAFAKLGKQAAEMKAHVLTTDQEAEIQSINEQAKAVLEDENAN